MGIQNLELAHERWGPTLRGDAWRAFAWMALRSWDVGQEQNGDEPRRYWGGHPLLAYGMGIIPRPMPLPAGARRPSKPLLTKSQAERVRRTVHLLADKHGAIAILEPGAGYQHAVYELQL